MSVEDFGLRLKKARKKKDMSQKELGEKIGVSGSSIAAYEANESKPGMDHFIEMIRILEVSADYILGIEPPYTNRDNFDLTESQIFSLESLDKNIKTEIQKLRDEFRKANKSKEST